MEVKPICRNQPPTPSSFGTDTQKAISQNHMFGFITFFPPKRTDFEWSDNHQIKQSELGNLTIDYLK